nr:hypothetical protein [Tanacetum cinerariifolium]
MTDILAKGMIGLSFLLMMVSMVCKVKVLIVLEMMEDDSGACIYEALVSVNTNDIFSNNEFSIFVVGRMIISKDYGRI